MMLVEVAKESAEDRCGEWYDDMWSKVCDYCIKLAAQREKEEDRKAKAAASSFSGFLSSVLVSLKCLSTSFDIAVVSSVATDAIDTCQVTYSTSSSIMLTSPFVFAVAFASGELSRPRKQDRSGSSFSISKERYGQSFRSFDILFHLSDRLLIVLDLLPLLPARLVGLLGAFIRPSALTCLFCFPGQPRPSIADPARSASAGLTVASCLSCCCSFTYKFFILYSGQTFSSVVAEIHLLSCGFFCLLTSFTFQV